jgi:hypothetical protein
MLEMILRSSSGYWDVLDSYGRIPIVLWMKTSGKSVLRPGEVVIDVGENIDTPILLA